MIERSELAVIGGSGLVGERVVKILGKRGLAVISPLSSEVDITDRESVERFVSNSEANAVVFLAAWTDVDGAQKDPEKAQRINVGGARNVAEVARSHGKFLVYISTDFVFPGTEECQGPYEECFSTAAVSSREIGEYGRSKLMGEEAVKEIGGDYAIVRIAYPFGNPNSPKDFAIKTLGYIKRGYSLFADQQFTPTYIPDLAEAIEVIVEKGLTGIFHVATHPPTTPYEFGQYLATRMGGSGEVKKGSMEDFVKKPGFTPRPKLGGLQTSYTQETLRLEFRSWREAIDELAEEVSAARLD